MNNPTDFEEALFSAALALPHGDRDRFLHRACGEDTALRKRMDHLLRAHDETDGVLDVSAVPQLPEIARVAADLARPEEVAGDCIGRYKLLEVIGEGGFGVVWMAEQETPVRRLVALKIIKAGMDTREVIARFEAERQALALMDHPNIARVLDAGATMTGRPYFVMELIRGVPVTTFCDDNGLSPTARLELFIKICVAIQHAHQKGLLHRDIKPSNILVTKIDGVAVPKVIDFGIAKAIQGKLTDKTLFTRFHAFVGTPAYISPEQAEMSNVDVDTRSDVYSLGVLLYELLSGRTPFDRDTLDRAGLFEMRRLIRETEPPRPSVRLDSLALSEQTTVAQRRSTAPAQLTGLLRGDLDWVVMRCLEKDRARRYESAAELGRDIRRHLDHSPVTARPPTPVYVLGRIIRRNRLWFAAGSTVAAAVLAALVLSTWSFVRERAAREGEERQRVLAENHARTISRNLYAAEMKAALQAWRDDNPNVAQSLAEKYQRPANGEDLRGFEWRHLWWLCHQELASIPAHSGAITELTFLPDGKSIITAGRWDGALKVWDLSSGRQIDELPSHANWLGSLFVLPDRRTLALDGNDGRVRLVDLSTKMETVLLGEATRGHWPLRLSPNGKWIASVDRENPRTLHLWDVSSGSKLSSLSGIEFPGPWMNDHKLVFASDSRLLAIGNAAGMVQLLSVPDLKELASLPLGEQPDALTFARDGSRLAAGLRGSGAVQLWDLRTRTLEFSLARKLHAPPIFDLLFSPDNRLLASSSRDNAVTLWDLSGKREVAVFKSDSHGGPSLAFSPDSKILASAGEEGKIKLWDARLKEETALESVPKETIVRVAISPDNRCFAFATNHSEVRLFDASTGGLLATLPAERENDRPFHFDDRSMPLAFSPDGRFLAVGHGEHVASIWDMGTKRRLHTLARHAGLIRCLSFSPDSKVLATGSVDMTVRVWDVRSGEEAEIIQANVLVYALGFSPDGNTLALAGFVGAQVSPLSLLDRTTGKIRKLLPREYGAIHSIAFSPDGEVIAAGQSDGSVQLWDLKSNAPQTAFAGCRGPVMSVCFTPDGKNLIGASVGGPVRIWHLSSMESAGDLTPLLLLRSAVLTVDGGQLVICSLEKVLEVFRAPPLREIDLSLGK